MGKLLNKLFGFLAVVACLLLLFITFSIGYSIFTRQLKLPTPVWVVQFNEYALLWITFLGTAWVLAKNKHVSIQLLTERMGEKSRVVTGLVHSLLGMLLCGVFCWYATFTTWEHFHRKVIDVGSVDIPKAYVLVVIPIGLCLLALEFLRKIIRGLSEMKALSAKTAEIAADQGETN